MLDFITKWGYFGTALIFASQVYKQIVLGWEIAKQLSRFNPLSPSNNKNYRLKKSRFFFDLSVDRQFIPWNS